MKTIQYFLTLLTLSCLVSNAQNKVNIIVIDNDPAPIYSKWLGEDPKILALMKLTYKIPDGFNEVPEVEWFKDYPKLKQTFYGLSNQLQSNDKQFIAFITTDEIPKGRDSIRMMQHLYPNNEYGNLDLMYIYQIKAIIKNYLGEKAANNWRKMASYYPDDVAKNTFNADAAIRFTITLQPQEYYKKKFKYIDLLCFQKSGRGFIIFYCFYTNKAKKKLDYYWKEIEGVLRYED